jgi:hypothetical protein
VPPVRLREFQGVVRTSLMEWHARCPNDVRCRADDGHRERWHTTMQSELSGNQHQLLRRLMCNSGQRRRSPDRMLHQTLSKGWCGHGSGLLLGLIVRARGGLVEARSRFAATENRSSCPAQRSGGPHPGTSSPSGHASAARGTSGASLGRIRALPSRAPVFRANSIGASEPWSPSCASCSGPSPESSLVLRPSFA